MYYISNILFILLSTTLTNCSNNKTIATESANIVVKEDLSQYSKAYFASGCVWCVEAVFESVTGVVEVISGYAGGDAKDANYSDVSAGITGHAEAVEVHYDPVVISYETLLVVFFGSQDPTTLNRQGNDAGTQYRSTIFYQNVEEKAKATSYIAKLTEDKIFDSPITTTLEPYTIFYAAEDYHQDYEARNPNQPYVKAVSVPRLNKFKKAYPELLKATKH